MSDLIETSRLLLSGGPDRPAGEAEFRRCVSTAYYAIFHALAGACADMFVGFGEKGLRRAWLQVFRALDHGAARAACSDASDLKSPFPSDLKEFARLFLQAQKERHAADYDPLAHFDARLARQSILRAQGAIACLSAADPRHKRAFAIFVLLRRRS